MKDRYKFDRVEVEQRLKDIAQKDTRSVPLFAARSSLRVFPLLAVSSAFDYWAEGDRATYLLSVWTGLVAAYCQKHSRQAASFASSAAQIVRSSHAGRRAALAVSSASAASYASAGLTASYASASATARAALAATLATEDSVSASFSESVAAAYSDASYRAINSDLEQLDSLGYLSLKEMPLWGDQDMPEAFIDMTSKLKAALDRLAALAEKTNPAAQPFITQIYGHFKQLCKGMTETRELDSHVQNLRFYFEHVWATTNASESKSGLSKTKMEKILETTNKRETASKAHAEDLTNRSKVDNAKNYDETEGNSADERPTDRISFLYEGYSEYSQHVEQVAGKDALNRAKLVEVLSTTLLAPNNTHHQTIGLLGDWGVGKSTVIELLKKDLLKSRDSHPFLFAEFNAWEYEHTDNLQAGVAQELIKALSSPRPKPDREWFWEKPKTVAHFKKLSSKNLNSLFDLLIAAIYSSVLWPLRRLQLTISFVASLQPWRSFFVIVLFLLIFASHFVSEIGHWIAALLFSSGAESDWLKIHVEEASKTVPYGSWVSSIVFTGLLLHQLKPLLASPLAKNLLTYLRLPQFGSHLGLIPVMRHSIKRLCRTRLDSRLLKKKRLLFVVDDLDRCNQEGIVKVLEAVRLVLDVERVIVIIAVDQRIALSAMAMHYEDIAKHHPTGNPKSIARDYMGKMIHLPITLSQPDRDSIDGYLDMLWEQNLSEGISLVQDKTTENLTLEEETLLPTPADLEFMGANPLNKDPEQKFDKDVPSSDEERIVDPTPHRESARPETTKTISVQGLTPNQKRAFKHWLAYFDLANPRQVKRLDNSYNLLRNYYNQENQEVFEEGDSSIPIYPLMVTLFVLEYINQIDNYKRRKTIKNYLSRPTDELRKDVEEGLEGKIITPAIAQVTSQSLLGGESALIDMVEPFVLPAIEIDILSPDD